MNDPQREIRAYFLPIAVVEHHRLPSPVLSVYDICDRLGQLWQEVQKEAWADAFTLDADCVLALHMRIAAQLETHPGTFRATESWLAVTAEWENVADDPSHVFSWLFSSLYWNHLTHLNFATAWMYINALRIQHGYSEYQIALDKLGPFLVSLSASGPPIYDGQTFYPDQYFDESLTIT